ncbi:glycosyltransferase [Vulcaniibacterium gelatinicum]|uniref:glycosyltransferase n=1 Tax=Vulcaniibacterium gelatinicum TaxID=2598725 RepID=UPI0015F2B938|nr:glycosyltransferase [Vulcaniibacterium gelatinicum]
MQTVNVLCIKWGSKYGPEYVNTLRSMVRRNLTRPHRFVCLTDDRTGIEPDIEVFDIPKVGIPDFDARKPWTFAHGWLKLTSFADPLYDLRGPTLFIDLDVVIVDSIDCFFDLPGEFLVIKEWDKRDETGNTSVYRYEIGRHADALAYLRDHQQEALAKVRNEQEFITGYLARQGKLGYWPQAWCRSFKRHCVRGLLLGWFLPPRIPEGAKIIAFHGKPNPPDAIAGRSGKWYRRVLPTPWVAEHWR